MGDEQRLGYVELLDTAREGFESGTDFTIAVEEEFALLDPATLDLVNRSRRSRKQHWERRSSRTWSAS